MIGSQNDTCEQTKIQGLQGLPVYELVSSFLAKIQGLTYVGVICSEERNQSDYFASLATVT